MPNTPISNAVPRIRLQARIGTRTWTPLLLRKEQLDSRTQLLSQSLNGGGQLKVTLGRAPVPTNETQQIVGHDDEMQEMLEALGYVTGNE